MAGSDLMISNVIGTAFNRTVLAQLYMRAAQNSGIGADTGRRTDEQVLFLANKSAWVRLISSVDITFSDNTPINTNFFTPPGQAQSTPSNDFRFYQQAQSTSPNDFKFYQHQSAASVDMGKYYEKLGIQDLSKYPNGNSLAERWVLEAGTSITNGIGVDLRYGLGGEGSYGLVNKYTLHDGSATEYQGYNPMPGLTSVQIDTAGRLGSLRTATINFKVWNMNQLNIVEALYFRLGYSMLLEWGHTQYFTNEGKFESQEIYGISDPFRSNLRKEGVQQEIIVKSRKTDGNYDGLYGTVSNFTWSFNQEGGYDCSVKLIGLGSIMDSLRINQSYRLPDGLIQKFKTAQQSIDAQRQAALEKAAKDAAEAAARANASATPTQTVLNVPKNLQELYTAATTDGYPPVAGAYTEEVKAQTFGVLHSHYPAYGLTGNTLPDYYFQSTAADKGVTNPAQFGLFIQRNSSNPWSRLPNTIGTKFRLAGTYINYPAFRAWSLGNDLLGSVRGQNDVLVPYDKTNISIYERYKGTNTVGPKVPYNWTDLVAIWAVATGTYLPKSQVLEQYDPSLIAYAVQVKNVEGALNTVNAVSDLILAGVQSAGVNLAQGAVNLVNQGLQATGLDVASESTALTAPQPYPYTLTVRYIDSAPKNKGKVFYYKITYNGPEGTDAANYQPTRKQVADALKTATADNAEMSLSRLMVESNGLVIYAKTAPVPVTVRRSTPPRVQAIPDPETQNETITFSIEFNNTALVNIVSAVQPPKDDPSKKKAEAGSSGDTSGKKNDADTSQTDQAFESALTAMLAFVKTVTQSESKNKLFYEYNLVKDTKRFFATGILSDIDYDPQTVTAVGTNFTGPLQPGQSGTSAPTPTSVEFDLKKYAQKGFNASLMADPNLYDKIPNVNFNKLCKSYLVRYHQGVDGETQDLTSARVYIQFGYLLAFLNSMCLIYDTTANKATTPTGTPSTDRRPYLYIDYNPETNFCLTAPQQMSVDPLTCLIPFQGSREDYQSIFTKEMFSSIPPNQVFDPLGKDNALSTNLPKFQKDNSNRGKIMNILLDVDYLLNMAVSFSTSDPEHSVNLKRFLETIVTDVNKSLGNFNVFRVAYIDESNTIQIRDDQFTPSPEDQDSILDWSYYTDSSNKYLNRLSAGDDTTGKKGVPAVYLQADISSLQYGQLPIFGLQSIARGFEFKTNTSTKLASMVAISAQADNGESVNAKDPTSLSYLNQNFQDRYKPRVTNASPPPSKSDPNKKDSKNNDETVAESFNKHIKSIYGDFEKFSSNRLEMAKNYYIERSSQVKVSSPITAAAPFIPADLEITIDGIGGIIMGQAFTIPEDRMPASLRGVGGYTKVGFIVTGLTHTIESNQWLTKIKGQMIKLRQDTRYGASQIINNIPINGTAAQGASSAPAGTPATDAECHPPYRGYSGAAQAPSDTIKNVYIPARDAAKLTISKGLQLLMTAQTQREGFHSGTLAFSSNNPGNIGTDTDAVPKRIKKFNSLSEGIAAQQQFYERIFAGNSKYYKPSDTIYQVQSQYAPACTRKSGVLVKSTNDPTGYTNFIINWFKYQGYTITAETTLAQINALA